jgi:glyoxylase-like metal-dependent hydrolase (beta-lactamase superfamily II)
VTYDPYRNLGGPRLLLDGVNEDTRQAVASLDRLERLDAEVLLPGHGDPWTGGVAQAVTQARGDPTVARRR